MDYLIALLFPPLAILMKGRVFQAFLNLLMCVVSVSLMLFGIGFLIHIAPIVHAFAVVSKANADRRQQVMISALQTANGGSVDKRKRWW